MGTSQVVQIFQGWCAGKTQRDGMGREEEGGIRMGTHVNPWLIHVNVWQKPLQYCKVISLQLIKINEKKKKKKNLPAIAGDIRDTGLILGSGRSPGGGHGKHSSILACRIPSPEEPGRLQSIGLHRIGHDRRDLA